MKKEVIIYKNKSGFIYFIESGMEEEADYVMVWEKSELFFNSLLDYQNKGFNIIFKTQQ